MGKREREKRTLGRSVEKNGTREDFPSRRLSPRSFAVFHLASRIYMFHPPRACMFRRDTRERTRDTRIWFTPRSMLVRSRSTLNPVPSRAYGIFRKIICTDESDTRWNISGIPSGNLRASSFTRWFIPLIPGLQNIYEDISLDVGIRSQMRVSSKWEEPGTRASMNLKIKLRKWRTCDCDIILHFVPQNPRKIHFPRFVAFNVQFIQIVNSYFFRNALYFLKHFRGRIVTSEKFLLSAKLVARLPTIELKFIFAKFKERERRLLTATDNE